VRCYEGPIGDLVKGPAVAVDAKTTLRSVAQTLGDLGIGIVIAIESDKPVGVVSEREEMIANLGGWHPGRNWLGVIDAESSALEPVLSPLVDSGGEGRSLGATGDSKLAEEV